MNEIHVRDPHLHSYCGKCFSFKSVVVGALVGFGLIFLFNLLTIGGGLSAYTKTEGGLVTLIFIAYLWVVVGSFIVFFIAGLVTTLIACHKEPVEYHHHRHSILYGFTAWVLYILISLAFLSRATELSVLTFPQNFTGITSDISAISERATDTTGTAITGQRGMVSSKQSTSVQAQKQAHKIGLATLAAFFVFFVEAIGCCFGAWCGVESCRK